MCGVLVSRGLASQPRSSGRLADVRVPECQGGHRIPDRGRMYVRMRADQRLPVGMNRDGAVRGNATRTLCVDGRRESDLRWGMLLAMTPARRCVLDLVRRLQQAPALGAGRSALA